MTKNQRRIMMRALVLSWGGCVLFGMEFQNWRQVPAWNTLFESKINGVTTVEIPANGKGIVFGPDYDRLVEARKLLEMVKIFLRDEGTAYCPVFNAEMIPDRHGVIKVYLGRADPPEPRLEWKF